MHALPEPKHRHFALLFAVAFLFTSLGAQAQQSPDPSTMAQLDIDTAVELALSYNLGIRSQRIDLTIAERDYAHRFNVLIPQFAAQGTLARPNNAPQFQDDPRWEMLGMGIEAEDPPRWNISGTVSAQLTLSAQMLHGVRAVTNAYHNSQTELQDAEREIEKQVRTLFYQLLLQQEQLALSQQRLAAAQARLDEVEQNYQAGLVDELTLRRTQVALETQRPAILRQQQGFTTAKQNLAATIGIAGLTDIRDIEIIGSIEQAQRTLTAEQELLMLLDRNSDIRSAQRGTQGIQTRIDLTRSEMLPSLTLAYSLNPTLSGDPFSGDVTDSDNWNDRGSFSLTLRQPIDPLLPGSRTRQQLANQRDQLKQMELRVDQARSGVELQTRRLAGEISAANQSIESLQSNVELAERAFELAEEAYNSGLRDFSVVRDAEIDLADSRLQLLQEQHRVIELLLELEYLLNTPMDDLYIDHSKETNQ